MKMRRISLLLIVAMIGTSLGIMSPVGFAALQGGIDNASAPLITNTTTNIELGGSKFKFIPNSSETYTIETINEVQNGPAAPDTLGTLYDSSGDIILTGINGGAGYEYDMGVDSYQDIGGTNNNFRFTATLTAGNTYYIAIQDWAASTPANTCDLKITGNSGGGLVAPATLSVTGASSAVYYKAGQTISVSGTVGEVNNANVTVSAIINGHSASTTVTGGNGPWTLTWDIDSLNIAENTYNTVFTASNGSSAGDTSVTHTGGIVVDKTAPTLSSTSATDIDSAGAKINFTSDQAGTYYYLLYLASDSAPNAATIKAQGTAIKKGSGAATAAVAKTVNLTGLSELTDYKAYVVVEDTASNISSVATIPVSTTAAPDVTAPILSSVSVSSIDHTGGTLNFTSDEAGTYYYLVYASGDAAPNAATIKLQGTAVAKGTSTVAASSATTSALGGLSASTTYKVYLIVADALDNTSIVSETAFTTADPPDVTPPTLSAATATSVSYTSGTMNFTSSETGTYYYVVYAAADATPSSATVKAQGTAIKKGTGTAFIPNTFSLSGLTAATDYNTHIVVEDGAGNLSDVKTISFTTLDNIAPILSNVIVSGQDDVGGILSFDSNETGTYYYLVYASGDSAPDAAAVKAQGTAVNKGTDTAALSNSATMSGLSATTTYKVYVVVEDASSNLSAVSSAAFSTTAAPDLTAPTLSSTSATGVTHEAATLNFTSDEAGDYYYLVYASGDSAPDSATVKAQGTAVAKGTNTATASANTASVSGLSASTDYKAYVVVQDSSNNLSSVSTISFSTSVAPDVTAPSLSAVSVTGLDHESGTLNFTTDEAGTYYYLVYPSANGAPNNTTVKAQGTAVAKGTDSAALGANTASITGLSPSTAYKVYVVAEDSSSNLSSVYSDAFSTTAAPDVTAPTLSGISVSGLSATGGTLNFTSNEAGTYYYLVYASSDSAPNATTVKVQGAAVAKGDGVAIATSNTASISGLSASTSYKVYVVVEDASNNISLVGSTSFSSTAAPDTTSPIITADSTSGISNTGVTLNFSSDEAGTYYYLVYGASESTPNAFDIKAQGTAVAKGTGSAGVSNSVLVSGMTPLTSYKAYVIVEDSANNLSNILAIGFTTSGTLVTVPGAPTGVSAAPGNQSAVVTFTAPVSNGGAEITSYVATASPGGLTGVCTGTSNQITVNGLTNGTAYTFRVVANNSAGTSSYSAVSNSVTPVGNSSLSASTSSFNKKTSAQADIVIVLTLNGNTLSSIQNGTTTLINGTDYTLAGNQVTLKKAYFAGQSVGTAVLVFNFSGGTPQSLSVTVTDTTSTSGNGGDKTSTGSTATSGAASTNPTSPTTTSGAAVIVNGETQSAGTAQNSTQNGQNVTKVVVDTAKLESVLAAKGEQPRIVVPVSTDSDVAIAGFTGQMVKNMEVKDATVVVETQKASYSILASEINIDAVSDDLGESVKLSDIEVQIKIAEPSDSTVKIVENSAKKGEFTLVAPAVEFSIECQYKGKTVSVDSFNSYVERTVAIPDGVDPSKITTGVVVNSDGSVYHVPTQVVVVDGKYFAKINSRTNSVYTVIWNPVTFTDVDNHWAKNSINNMGSRLVVSGDGTGKFNPNADITRAEFAAIIVRALGLSPATGQSQFSDVKVSDWYSGYIEVARKYGIINGYDETTFAPNDKITREQAMTMIYRAMKITGLNVTLTDSELNALLTKYTDGSITESFAKSGVAACIKAGIVSGTSDTTLAPKQNITRAEVAVIIERLLKKSNLI